MSIDWTVDTETWHTHELSSFVRESVHTASGRLSTVSFPDGSQRVFLLTNDDEVADAVAKTTYGSLLSYSIAPRTMHATALNLCASLIKDNNF